MKKTLGALSIGIIGSIIGSFIYDSIVDQPIFSSLETTIIFFKSTIGSFLSLKISLWIIILSLFLVVVSKRIYNLLQTRKIPTPPKYTDYKKDKFHDWIWKWNWEYDSNEDAWIITNLVPYCPECNVRLIDRSHSLEAIAECPSCKKRFKSSNSKFEDSESTLNLIYSNIENENYKTG